MNWKRIEASGDFPKIGRMGHTLSFYNDYVVIFGGEKQFNPVIKTRECLRDLRMFNRGN